MIALLLQRRLQLLQHDPGDAPEVLLRQLVEIYDLVHTVDKLRAQELLQGLHHPLLILIVCAAAEAHSARRLTGPGIGGHDDDGILKVHLPPVGIRDLAVIQNLQQDVQHIRMGLFDLVEQHHGVGLAPDLLRQLPRLVIAHIARRRAHQPGDGVLLHKLRHIQPDQRIR